MCILEMMIYGSVVYIYYILYKHTIYYIPSSVPDVTNIMSINSYKNLVTFADEESEAECS